MTLNQHQRSLQRRTWWTKLKALSKAGDVLGFYETYADYLAWDEVVSEPRAAIRAMAVAVCEKIKALEKENAELRDAAERMRAACVKQDHEISQVLGKAIGYPAYMDDQAAFPGAISADGVCTGDHVAETLAMEAAARLTAYQAEAERMREAIAKVCSIMPLFIRHQDIPIGERRWLSKAMREALAPVLTPAIEKEFT